MTQHTITDAQIERTRARELGMVGPQIVPPSFGNLSATLRIDFPSEGDGPPRLVIEIPLPWSRLSKLWSRIGGQIRRKAGRQ